MSLLSTTHVDAIEAFFAADRTADSAVQRSAVQRSAVQRSAVQRSAVQRSAVQLVLTGGHLEIEQIPTRDLPVGWLAEPVPPSADAIGIVLPVDKRGHLGAIVDRSGSSTWFAIERGRLRFDASASCQLLDDLARCRLHQPTDPPVTGTDWYWLGQWLRDLQLAIVAPECHFSARGLDAVAAAGWHPAVDPDDLFGLGLEIMVSLVVDRHRDHAFVADWECVRLDALADRHHRFHRMSSLLDEGAFSRWVTACSQPLVRWPSH